MVIGIIALLIAILLPALGRAREASSKVACSSNMRQWATAVNMYVSENKGYLPLFGLTYAQDGPEPTLWWNTLVPYLKQEQALTGGYYGSQSDAIKKQAKIRACPSDPEYTFVGPHYGGFHYADGTVYGPFVWGRYNAADKAKGLRITQIKRFTRWIIFAETTSPYYQVYSPSSWIFNTDTDKDGIADTFSYYAGWNNYNGGRPKVHRGTSNVAFADGHVENLAMKVWLTDLSYWVR